MKEEIKKFKKGDRIEITEVENGFIVVLKPSNRYPRKARLANIDDFEYEEESLLNERDPKVYVAEHEEEVSKIVTGMFNKKE